MPRPCLSLIDFPCNVVVNGRRQPTTEDGAVTPMGNVREEVWEAAMSIKD